MPMNASAQSPRDYGLREARVSCVAGKRVRVRPTAEPSSGELEARVAVPGYQPCPGDRVLVHQGDAVRAYLVGVLHATSSPTIATPAGATASVVDELIALRAADGTLLAAYDAARGELVLAAPEHLKLRAPGGRVSLEAAELAVRASVVTWAVGHWELGADRIVERTRDAFRHVEGILETRARRARTLVDRTLELVARRTSVTSEEDTHIDGKRVLLG